MFFIKRNKFMSSFIKKNDKNDIKNNINMKDEIQKSLWNSMANINIIVSNSRKKSINVFIPQVYPYMSAGPMSILYFIKFLFDLKKYNIRLLVNSNQTNTEIKEILHKQSPTWNE